MDSKVSKGVDKLTKSLKQASEQAGKTQTSLEKIGFTGAKGVDKLTSSLEGAARTAGKVRDIIESINGGKNAGVSGLADAMADTAKAADHASQAVEGIGRSANKAGLAANDMVTTLLKAEALNRIGDAFVDSLQKGANIIRGTLGRGASFTGRMFNQAKEDEMSDIKAQSSVMGSFTKAGYKGSAQGGGVSYGEAGKFYKQIDRAVAEKIRTSSAPTSKVVELQRQTLDTLGPLLFKAEGIKTGTDIRKVDPKVIQKTATGYAGLLEQVALLSQGTGSATFRVSQGIEQLITAGKIDTTMDFFTDNVLFMQALQQAGFAGGATRGGKRTTTLKTQEARLVALAKALEIAQPREGINAMANSLTGSLQALGDTLTNPSVGIFGMATTFTEREQAKVNNQLKRMYDRRILAYETELKSEKTGALRAQQLRADIKRSKEEYAFFTKQGEEQITTPFKAFSVIFSGTVRSLTKLLNTIGPIWNNFAVSALEFTDRFLHPLEETFRNLSSDMAADLQAGTFKPSEAVGRIAGEFYKFIGDAMGALADAFGDPSGPLSEVEKQFSEGFMAAFGGQAGFEKAGKNIERGVTMLINKLFESIGKVITSDAVRPIILPAMALLFGPSLLSAVIAGATPLILVWIAGLLKSLATAMITANIGGFIAGNLPLIVAAGSKLAAGLTAIGAGLATFTTTVLLPFLAIAAGIAGIVLIIRNWNFVMKGVVTALGIFKNTLMNIIDSLIAWVARLPVIGGLVGGQATAKAAESRKTGRDTENTGKWRQIDSNTQASFAQTRNDLSKLSAATNLNAAATAKSSAGLTKLAQSSNTGSSKITESVNRTVASNTKLTLSWKSTVVTSQAKLAAAAASMGSAITSAANKIKSASGGMGAPGSPTAPTATGGEPRKGVKAMPSYSGSIGTNLMDAISEERKNMPKGAELVIANSSETVIPANKGINMGGIAEGLENFTKKINELGNFAASSFGGILGGAGGSLGAAAVLARAFGLTMTSFKRNGGGGSYHDVGRAMDFSNSTGPTPQMMAFAQAMASKFGGSMAELIYTPLGFGIKHGRKVPPYAASSHYNHVHVAFAHGLGDGRFFPDAASAISYERAMAPSGARVSSITANSSEGFGTTTINAPITISGYQKDPEELASLVVLRLSQAMDEIRSASMYS
jgi:hypothetical protein